MEADIIPFAKIVFFASPFPGFHSCRGMNAFAMLVPCKRSGSSQALGLSNLSTSTMYPVGHVQELARIIPKPRP